MKCREDLKVGRVLGIRDPIRFFGFRFCQGRGRSQREAERICYWEHLVDGESSVGKPALEVVANVEVSKGRKR